ncbi:proton-conducting transporter membrane subunit [Streptomyces sp. M19]
MQLRRRRVHPRRAVPGARGALLTALLSMNSVADSRLPAGEFWFLLLSSAAGAALLPASRDLATLVVALEVASLPAFALVGLRRGDRLSSEAALKFFLSSVTATAVTLLGVSFVYAATGSLHLSEIADGLRHTDPRLHTSPRRASSSPSSASPSRRPPPVPLLGA